jgi:uncharacterized membrane protein YbhN (UPF0104 family)
VRLSSPGALARLAVAAALTSYILWKSDPGAVGAALAGADRRFILIAVVLVFADRALMAYRWLTLLCIVPAEQRPPLPEVLRIFFVSTFVGTFLPASLGGDAVRAYSMAKLRVGGGDAVASIFMDRMLGVASILLMAVVGLAFASDLASNWTIVTALAAAAAVCGITLLAIFSSRAGVVLGACLAGVPALVSRPGASLLESIRRYAMHHGRLANVFAGSVAVQVLRIVQAYFLGAGLGIAAPLSAYFAFIPLILLVMLLPVTINGIGTSQVAFVWFFGRAGVTPADAFALSVLFVALGLVGNLPGALLYVWRRPPGPTA